MLPKYPFPMCGTIERCWLFTFREPVASVAPLVPEPLVPVTRDGYAFWNVVVCEIGGMRPSFVPRALGIRYRHVAYRLYVRHDPAGSPAVEGLYFLRSDADSHLIGTAGKLLSDFRFRHAEVEIEQGEHRTSIEIGSRDAPGKVDIDLLAPPELPEGSPFGSLFEAKAVLKYKPYALAPDGRGGVRVLRVHRDELAWKSKLVAAETDFAFLRDRDVEPEINYQVDPIEYRWEKVKVERSTALGAGGTPAPV